MDRPKLVDIHAHCLPRTYRQAAHDAGLTSFDGGFPIPPWGVQATLDFMDHHRITAQVLSVTSPPVHVLAGKGGAATLAARVNGEIAEIVTLHPDRFTATAVLPLPDVTATLKAIDHCFDVLGVCGATLFTHYQGHYLGDPLYEPVFAALNERRALVLLHPTSPVCAEQTRLGRPAPVIEFPLDTTRAVVNLLYTGTLQRHPNLRIVVPHAGAAIPALAWRIARFADLPLPGKQDTLTAAAVMAQLRSLYYDVALSANPHALAALHTLAAPDRILFGSDYPFAPETAVHDNITGLASSSHLTEAAREAIGCSNAFALMPALRLRLNNSP
jgi:predicted TIM-barrel fold metal-dependent hydrolase